MNLRELTSEDSRKEITFNLYQSTRMIPDMDIRYPGKSRLKRRTLRQTGLKILLPAVAAATILAGALLIFNQEGNIPVRQEISGTENQVQPVITDAEPLQERSNIAQTSIPEPKGVQKRVIPVAIQTKPVGFRESIRISRVQPLGIKKVLTVTTIPSYDLMYKLREDPGKLEMLALDMVDSRLQATRVIPEKARNALWKLADAGVNGLNRISEEEFELSRDINSNGKTNRFKFESSLFGISTPIQNIDILQ